MTVTKQCACGGIALLKACAHGHILQNNQHLQPFGMLVHTLLSTRRSLESGCTIATGTLPADLPGWSSLSYLKLAGNMFSGTLPASWGDAHWPQLTFVDLHLNSLTGMYLLFIAAYCCNMTRCEVFPPLDQHYCPPKAI